MTSKTKSALVAVLIAAFATPALAQGAALTQRHVTEGRNAVIVHDYDTFNGTSSGRDSVVQSLGN
jgi:hypothetical protein